MGPRRFPIRFDAWYRVLSSALFLPPARCYVEVGAEEVEVRMGWAFRARFPRAAVASAAESHGWFPSRGVHGSAGRWLVNGSGRGIVEVELAPTQRALVLGFPMRLKRLRVSAVEPALLVAALGGPE